jgi:hypothetical protein
VRRHDVALAWGDLRLSLSAADRQAGRFVAAIVKYLNPEPKLRRAAALHIAGRVLQQSGSGLPQSRGLDAHRHG